MAWRWRSRRSAILLGDLALHVALILYFVLGVIPEPRRLHSAGDAVLSLAVPSSASASAKASSSTARPVDTAPPPSPTAMAHAAIAANVGTPAASRATRPQLSVEQRVEAILGIQSSALNAPAAPATQSAGVSTDTCDLTPNIQAALAANPGAVAAARALPPATLSMANAYMLWDAGWVEPRAVVASQALDPIRKVLVEQTIAATPECRDQLQVGPRLIVLGTDTTAVTLVIGSGDWRWGDLVSRADQGAPSTINNRVTASR